MLRYFCLIGLFFICPLKASYDEEILTYWFGPIKNSSYWPEDKNSYWFSSKWDQEIEKKFGPMIEVMELCPPKTPLPKERLALIILFDQFPRNAYRGTRRAFQYDPISLNLAKQGIALGDDRKLLPIERMFFYMPLMHAEDLPTLDLCVQKFEELVYDSPESIKSSMETSLSFAKRHQALIAEFGRYPHRNNILGRISTPAEIEALKDPKNSF